MSTLIEKVIPGCRDYTAGSDGMIRSHIKGRVRVLAARPCRDGWRRVKVQQLKKYSSTTSASLVCTAFHGPPPTPLHRAFHINFDSSDDRPENLKWETQSKIELLKWQQAIRTVDVPALMARLEAVVRALQDDQPVPAIIERSGASDRLVTLLRRVLVGTVKAEARAKRNSENCKDSSLGQSGGTTARRGGMGGRARNRQCADTDPPSPFFASKIRGKFPGHASSPQTPAEEFSQ